MGPLGDTVAAFFGKCFFQNITRTRCQTRGPERPNEAVVPPRQAGNLLKVKNRLFRTFWIIFPSIFRLAFTLGGLFNNPGGLNIVQDPLDIVSMWSRTL